MLSTMQDRPLTIAALFAHGRTIHGSSEVVTCEGERVRRARFTEVAARAERLAAALRRLGIRPGDRVATFSWNTQEHLEAYLAVPSMGAVLHTLNIRLFPEQLAYNNAGYGQEGAFEEVPMAEVRRQFRDQRLRPDPLDAARPPRHAPPGLGPDRQPLLDGRAAHAPGRRVLPRYQRTPWRRSATRSASS